MLLLSDIVFVVGISLLVARSFMAYCSDVGLPFTWVMSCSGDEYDGEVLNISKPVKMLFTEIVEQHSVPHGYGLYTFKCGTEYDGGWKEGKMCGVHGKLTFVEGHVYDGEWADGLPNGHGTFTWDGGSVFMGEFANGLPDGQVVLFALPLHPRSSCLDRTTCRNVDTSCTVPDQTAFAQCSTYRTRGR